MPDSTQCRSFPPLPRSYKNRFPFRLSVPSYIYPADVLPNVRALAPFVDEIELVFFESSYEGSIPSREVVKELKSIGDSEGISYNIHLPTDIDLADQDNGKRTGAVETIAGITELTDLLTPSTRTLHLPVPGAGWPETRDLMFQSLESLFSYGINSRDISVENLDADLEPLEPLIEHFDMSVCIDTGHLTVRECDPLPFYEKYRDRTVILHLHGSENGSDHIPLVLLSRRWKLSLETILKQFRGVVSVEVFSYKYLCESLRFFDALC